MALSALNCNLTPVVVTTDCWNIPVASVVRWTLNDMNENVMCNPWTAMVWWAFKKVKGQLQTFTFLCFDKTDHVEVFWISQVYVAVFLSGPWPLCVLVIAQKGMVLSGMLVWADRWSLIGHLHQ